MSYTHNLQHSANITGLLARAEAEEGRALPLDDDARAAVIAMADGDGRAILTLAEEVYRVEDRESGLRGFIALHSTRLAAKGR